MVLSYHNVVRDERFGYGDRSLHLALPVFEAQLKMLRSIGEIVPLDTLLAETHPSSRLIAITFDDAYAGALEFGVGLCEAEQTACTVFVSPALLGTIAPWDAYAAALRWSESARNEYLQEGGGLRSDQQFTDGKTALEASGAVEAVRIATVEELDRRLKSSTFMRVGNHTFNHVNLSALSAELAWRDIHEGMNWLQVRFPERVQRVVAYPYGLAPSVEVRERLRLEGICGLLNSGGWQLREAPVSMSTFPRWNIPAGISERGFKLRLARKVS
jgi:peptidoglycan/xylan/chitin deacetylase (PgdA/CDA1 family)